MSCRIGIDVGGTFTDFLLSEEGRSSRSHKVLSTPDDPSVAVIEGLDELARQRGQTLPELLREVEVIVHGTTVTTNAVLTGQIAKTGLLTTVGFRDALEMRRGIREKLYDNKYKAPKPLVPRTRRLPVRERTDSSGNVVQEIALEDVEQAARLLQAEKVQAIAVCFMHSYANATNEAKAAERLRALLPEAYLSVSSEILPQVRFYERVSTTVLNAAVGPILKTYIDSLRRKLAAAGYAGVVLIMQSNGGVTTPEVATRIAASTLLSGPAAAPVAGLAYVATMTPSPRGEEGRGEAVTKGGARTERPKPLTPTFSLWEREQAAGVAPRRPNPTETPFKNDSFIGVDMGGTSFDAALIKGGTPAITTHGSVQRMAMALPSMEIITIGAGGGSIAWIDDGGLLRMGPQSAGAKPGPVCYGLGGVEATCTDANLVLGYLNADFFAGGRIHLHPEGARAAIATQVAKPLGLSVMAAAAGMYRIINVNMASAIREISVQKGFDPREFPLVCAGGAAAIHAGMIARELGITRVLIPREAPILCAAGMLRSDLQHDFVRSYAAALEPGGWDKAQALRHLDDMLSEAATLLATEGIGKERCRFAVRLDLRYRGQYHEVTVDVPEDALREGDVAAISKLFAQEHNRLYGYDLYAEATPLELVSIRLTATGLVERPPLPVEPFAGTDARNARKSARPIYLPTREDPVEVDVYDGEQLRHGNAVSGPALVESANTTVLVPEGFNLTIDALGTCVLNAREEAAAS
jgi:N-methylhydantoinase A